MDSFVAAGVDIIMLNVVDAKAIAPAVKKAQAAGVIIAAFDVSAPGADVTVMTNNIKAGEEACQYIVDQLKGKGDVVIINGPASSSTSAQLEAWQREVSDTGNRSEEGLRSTKLMQSHYR